MLTFISKKFPLPILFGGVICCASSIFAEDSNLLTDRNGDGVVTVAALGDSTTYGVGDGNAPGIYLERLPEGSHGIGYPGRLAALLKIPVFNAGVAGETLTEGGVARVPMVARASKADTMIVLEGVNDAVFRVTTDTYSRSLQRSINVIRALGVEPIIATIPPPAATHDALAPYSNSYSVEITVLAYVNEVPLIDFKRAWTTTCRNLDDCELYNLPEGLHPNKVGYDVMAQTAAATLLGIDIFKIGGAAELESALGIPAGTVVVKPEVVQ